MLYAILQILRYKPKLVNIFKYFIKNEFDYDSNASLNGRGGAFD